MTEGQTNRPTDGRVIAYSALSVCYMLLQAKNRLDKRCSNLDIIITGVLKLKHPATEAEVSAFLFIRNNVFR